MVWLLRTRTVRALILCFNGVHRAPEDALYTPDTRLESRRDRRFRGGADDPFAKRPDAACTPGVGAR